ncbi:MAG: DUF418 domain-containing protein [Rhizobacter sp.]|nr:DUF418 domain-containing protein [Ferruginibacter sp.]
MHSNTSSFSRATAAARPQRIVMMDSLRGIAVLGILLVNIAHFALPYPASNNLTLNNELGTINERVWYFVNWCLEGSQRAIFSMLFGAGIILFLIRIEKRIEGILPAEYFIRRQLWLLFFGLVNAFVLLWPGDILFQYAICGIIIFVFRRLRVTGLLVAAGICLVLMTARENIDLFRQHQKIWKGEAIAQLDTTNIKLTDVQKEALGAMTGFKEGSGRESQEKEMKKNLQEMRGSYGQVYQSISRASANAEFYYSYYAIWDILLFMFIGMAFYKCGILTGKAPVKIYWALCIGGLGLGLLVSYFRIQALLLSKFNVFDYTKSIVAEYYEIARTLRSLGIFGFIMLLYKSGMFGWLFKLMRPVGQMAFTNYLSQSVICAVYFYGFGFGMYGHLQRYEMYYVVAAIWVVQIIWSHAWLVYFHYGPLEWIWRNLTYWKIQPLKKRTSTVLEIKRVTAGQ